MTPCDNCGRFLCEICAISVGSRQLCAECLSQLRKQKNETGLVHYAALFDNVALFLVTAPLFTRDLLVFHNFFRSDLVISIILLLVKTMESAASVPTPLWHRHPVVPPADRALGVRHLLPCDRPKITPRSQIMSYIKISNGGLLMTVIPGLRTKLYLGLITFFWLNN